MILQQTSEEVLVQLTRLLDELDDDQYRNPVRVLSDESIGAHVRHVIEFYNCLLKGLETGSVDYDSRPRNILFETERSFAIETIQTIIRQIHAVQADRELHICLDLSLAGNPIQLSTGFYRELAYNIEHAIHHMAIIRIAVESEYVKVVLQENFGIAYSTIRNRNRLCAQ